MVIRHVDDERILGFFAEAIKEAVECVPILDDTILHHESCAYRHAHFDQAVRDPTLASAAVSSCLLTRSRTREVITETSDVPPDSS